jgi:hypothetical protein
MQLSTAASKLLIYQAFIEEETGFPKHLARRVHDLYFQPLRLARRNGCNAGCTVTQSCTAHQTPIPIPGSKIS